MVKVVKVKLELVQLQFLYTLLVEVADNDELFVLLSLRQKFTKAAFSIYKRYHQQGKFLNEATVSLTLEEALFLQVRLQIAREEMVRFNMLHKYVELSRQISDNFIYN